MDVWMSARFGDSSCKGAPTHILHASELILPVPAVYGVNVASEK